MIYFCFFLALLACLTLQRTCRTLSAIYLASVTFLILPLHFASAQNDTDVVNAASVFVEWVSELAKVYPTVSTVVIVVSGFFMFLDPAIGLAKAIVAYTANKTDDAILEKLLESTVFKFIYSVLKAFKGKNKIE